MTKSKPMPLWKLALLIVAFLLVLSYVQQKDEQDAIHTEAVNATA